MPVFEAIDAAPDDIVNADQMILRNIHILRKIIMQSGCKVLRIQFKVKKIILNSVIDNKPMIKCGCYNELLRDLMYCRTAAAHTRHYYNALLWRICARLDCLVQRYITS